MVANTRRSLVITFMLAVTLTGLVLWHKHAAVLNWDDVDYVNAAKLGFWANYLDSGSLSIPAFIVFSRAKLKGTAVLPSGYDENKDPFRLRHYHPPLGFYLLVLTANASSDRVVRLGQLVGALLLIAVTLVVYATVSPALTASGFVSVATLSVWAAIHLFASLSPHGWAALWCVLVPFLVVLWLLGKEKRVGLMLTVVLGATVATQMPFPAIWIATLALLVVSQPAGDERRLTWRDVLSGAALAVAVAFVLWPGGFLKISLLKTAAVQTYRLHGGHEFAPVANRMKHVVVFLMPGLAAVIPATIWVSLRHRSERQRWRPFLVIGVVYMAVLLRFALNPVYLLPAVCALIPLVGFAIDGLRCIWSRELAAIGCSILPLVAVAQAGLTPIDARGQDDFAWLRTELVERDTLADGAHVIQHYLGPRYKVGRLYVDYGETSLSLRRGGMYRPLEFSDIKDRTILVLKRRKAFFKSNTERWLVAAHCVKQERSTLVTYNCP